MCGGTHAHQRYLVTRFAANDGLEVADDRRKRVRPDGGADEIVRRADVRDPIPHGFVDGILQRPAARVHRHHRGAEQLHAEHIQRLAAHIFGAHVDDELQAELGANRGARHAVLSGARLGNDAPVARPMARGQWHVPSAAREPESGRTGRMGRGAADRLPRRRANSA